MLERAYRSKFLYPINMCYFLKNSSRNRRLYALIREIKWSPLRIPNNVLSTLGNVHGKT
jgi:hypothetical protein